MMEMLAMLVLPTRSGRLAERPYAISLIAHLQTQTRRKLGMRTLTS